jgi:cell division transport system permease protein
MKIDSQNNIARLRMAQGFDRKFLMWRRAVKYGVSNFSRNIWLSLAAILVMSFTLLIVFVVAAATVSLNDTVALTKIEKMDLSLYLRSDTPENVQENLKADLEASSNVVYVEIVPKADSVDDLKAKVELDDDILAIIEEGGQGLADILPVVAQIHVKDVADIDDITAIVTSDASQYQPFLDANLYGNQFFHGDNQKTVQSMTSLTNTIQMIGLAVGGVFLLITILVIFNTIRLAIFARKDEIEMEKLIGAERSYVRGPFLVEAELYGVISGMVAAAVGYGLVIWAVPAVLDGGSVSGVSLGLLNQVLIGWAWAVVLVMVVLGILIGNISARLAIRKYLHY